MENIGRKPFQLICRFLSAPEVARLKEVHPSFRRCDDEDLWRALYARDFRLTCPATLDPLQCYKEMALRFRRFQKGQFAASILTGHSGPVTAVLPGSAGTFVTAGKDETLCIWGESQVKKTFTDIRNGVLCLAANAPVLAVGTGKSVMIFHAERPKKGQEPELVMPLKEPPLSLVLSKTTIKTLAAVMTSGVMLWRLSRSGRKVLAQSFVSVVKCSAMGLSPDGSLLATGEKRGDVKLWDVVGCLDPSGGELAEYSRTNSLYKWVDHQSPISCLKWGDNRILFSGDEQGAAIEWDVQTKNMKKQFLVSSADVPSRATHDASVPKQESVIDAAKRRQLELQALLKGGDTQTKTATLASITTMAYVESHRGVGPLLAIAGTFPSVNVFLLDSKHSALFDRPAMLVAFPMTNLRATSLLYSRTYESFIVAYEDDSIRGFCVRTVGARAEQLLSPTASGPSTVPTPEDSKGTPAMKQDPVSGPASSPKPTPPQELKITAKAGSSRRGRRARSRSRSPRRGAAASPKVATPEAKPKDANTTSPVVPDSVGSQEEAPSQEEKAVEGVGSEEEKGDEIPIILNTVEAVRHSVPTNFSNSSRTDIVQSLFVLKRRSVISGPGEAPQGRKTSETAPKVDEKEKVETPHDLAPPLLHCDEATGTVYLGLKSGAVAEYTLSSEE